MKPARGLAGGEGDARETGTNRRIGQGELPGPPRSARSGRPHATHGREPVPFRPHSPDRAEPRFRIRNPLPGKARQHTQSPPMPRTRRGRVEARRLAPSPSAPCRTRQRSSARSCGRRRGSPRRRQRRGPARSSSGPRKAAMAPPITLRAISMASMQRLNPGTDRTPERMIFRNPRRNGATCSRRTGARARRQAALTRRCRSS